MEGRPIKPGKTSPKRIRQDNLGLVILIVIACLSTAVYVAVAVLSRRFTYGGDQLERPILTVLSLLAAAFVLYLAAIWVAIRIPLKNGDTLWHGRPGREENTTQAGCPCHNNGLRLLGVIVAASVLFRLAMVFSWPILEIDIYRYLWDGEVAAHGENPFRYSPQQVLDANAEGGQPQQLARLAELRDSSPAIKTILSRVHYEKLPTIYPPVSQAVFAFCSSITPRGATVFQRLTIMKIVFVLFDLGTLAVVIALLHLAGRHIGWSLAYGWCPLVVKETANCGHGDAIAVFLTSVAILIAVRALFHRRSSPSAGWGMSAAAVLGLAVGAKLYPLVLVPLFAASWARRFGWRQTAAAAAVFVAVSAVVLWPMMAGPKADRPQSEQTRADAADSSGSTAPQAPAKSLKAYMCRWEMNDFIFMLVFENLRPDGDRAPDKLPWFVLLSDSWRQAIAGHPAAWFGVEPSDAAFMLARIATGAILLLLVGVLAWRAAKRPEIGFWLQAAFLSVAWLWLLSPTQNPWYWIWAMPLVMFARGRIWLLVSGLALIYYLRFWLGANWPNDVAPATGYSGTLMFDYVVAWLEFFPWFLFLAFFAAFHRFARAGPVEELKDACTRLIIFTRYAETGKTKTRLIPALGAKGAADLQRDMTRKTLRWAEELETAGSATVEVYYTGGDEALMRRMFGNALPYHPQVGEGLGQRLADAFSEAFRSGARRVVAIGSDCPGLSRPLVEYAFKRLAENDLVIGPATDGGYYLIGLERDIPQLFADIPWGSGDVLWATLRKAEELRLSIATLEKLRDVDRPEDLDFLNLLERGRRVEHGKERISVIIPTFNEGHELLEKTVRSTRQGQNTETIIVSTCPSPALRKLAHAHAARLLTAPKGRARQMNAGAAAARGQILLFLHADTRVPNNFDRYVRQILEKPDVAGGAFRLEIEAARGTLAWIARLANLRARLLQMPYGDQAVFVRAETFQKLGGYPDVPILEDVELIRLLSRSGRVEIAQPAVVTSARRWHELGTWRTTLINQEIMAGYYLGVSKQRLAQWYNVRSD